MNKLTSFYKQNQLKTLLVALLVVGMSVSISYIYATPHSNSDNLRTSAATPCVVSAILVNSCRPWQGAIANNYPGVGSGLQTRITDFETRTNIKVDFAHDFSREGAVLSADDIHYVTRANTYLLLNYKPAGDWASAGGSNTTVNTEIGNMADSIKAQAPHKILLVVWHEPNNDVSGGAAGCASNFAYVGNTGTPAQYRAMWQNVRNIFDAHQVSNVVWGMIYMSGTKWDCMQKELWPGNNLVDWTMWDQYFQSGQTFKTGTDRFYNWLNNNSDATHAFSSKPYGIGEWGVWNNSQAEVNQIYIDGGKALQANTYPNLKLWTVYDSIGTNDSRVGYDTNSVKDANEQAVFNANWAQNSAFSSGVSTPPVDATNPTISISGPAAGTTVSGVLTIGVAANDNVGVTRVRIVWDGTNVIRDSTSQGTYGWGSQWGTSVAADGSHSITATAYDAAGNTSSSSVTVTVKNGSTVPAPTISSFSVNPSSITVGQTTSLSWTDTNAKNCSVNPGGPQATTATTWTTLALSTVGTSTYTLVCQNSAAVTTSKTASVTIKAAATPPSTVVLSASSTAVASGGNVLLSWSSNGATSCVLNPGSYSASGGSSSKTITGITSATTFKVVCSNTAGDTTSNSVTVNIQGTGPAPAPVIVSLTATPTSLPNAGETSQISWQTSNVAASGCSLTPSPLSATGGSGSWLTPALDSSASYTLTCVNSDNVSVSKSVSVSVGSTPIPADPTGTAPTDSGSTNYTTPTLQATSGQTVVNGPITGSVTNGELLTLDPSDVLDAAKIKNISKIEFYDGNDLIETVSSPPFALDTSSLKPGSHTLTARTYYADGSTSQNSQVITIKAKAAAVHKSGSNHTAVIITLIVLLLVTATAVVILRRWGTLRFRNFSAANNDQSPVVIIPTEPSSADTTNDNQRPQY